MTSTVDEIGRQIAALQSARSQPVVIAFANLAYAELMENWLWHMNRIGIDNVTICALDDDTFTLAQRNGAAAVRVADTSGLADLWILRAQIFQSLACQGVDFIHSDIDAVWLRDPRSRLLDTNVELAFSQGTIWPRDIVREWEFVLCCGLFLARGSPAVSAFFDRLNLRIVAEKDDQISVNRGLRDDGIIWNMDAGDAGRSRRAWNGTEFSVFADPVLGRAGTLSLALMPHDEFPRLPDSISPCTLVAHPLTPKDAKAKIERLRELRLWHHCG